MARRLISTTAAALAATVALMLGAPSAAAQPSEPARVMLVLDASGSMWARVAGRTKMDIAKDTVAQLLQSWNPRDELGLVAYGHRTRDACDDIEVLSDPVPLDRGRYLRAVTALVPKGKTPMTEAVRQAAEALRWTEGKATIILVSDGIETCGADPCAVAADLKRQGVGLTVHTVGFALDDPAARGQLQCMAQATGGLALVAENANELVAALETTVRAASPSPRPPPAAAARVATLATFTGTVRLSHEGPPIPRGITPSWQFYKDEGGEQGEFIDTQYGAEVQQRLPPGRYQLVLSVNHAKRVFPLVIEPGRPTRLEALMNAGVVRFLVEPPQRSPAVSIYDENGDLVATEYASDVTVVLAAGRYRAEVAVGNATSETPFGVAPGSSTTQTLTFTAGQLVATARFTPRGPPMTRDVAFEVYKAAKLPDGSREHVNTHYDARSVFDLPAGRYAVVLKSGLVEAEEEVEVVAGRPAEVTITADAGILEVRTPTAGAIVVLSPEKDIYGEHEELARHHDARFQVVAPAKPFLVRFEIDGAVQAEKLVEVAPGRRTEVVLP